MRDFMQGGFVVYDSVTFGEPQGGSITIQGQIQCLGGINIDVDKKLQIVGGTDGDTRVTKSDYSYNVSVSGRGNRFRYDGPHDHRPHHHLHRFDQDGRETAVLEIRNENEVPTLGDVIAEAHDYYYSPEFWQENEQRDNDEGL